MTSIWELCWRNLFCFVKENVGVHEIFLMHFGQLWTIRSQERWFSWGFDFCMIPQAKQLSTWSSMKITLHVEMWYLLSTKQHLSLQKSNSLKVREWKAMRRTSCLMQTIFRKQLIKRKDVNQFKVVWIRIQLHKDWGHLLLTKPVQL